MQKILLPLLVVASATVAGLLTLAPSSEVPAQRPTGDEPPAALAPPPAAPAHLATTSDTARAVRVGVDAAPRRAVHADYEVCVTVDAPDLEDDEGASFTILIEGPLGGETQRLSRTAAAGAPTCLTLHRPGRYSVRAAGEGWLCNPEWIELAPGAASIDIALLADRGQWIEGRVLDPDGQPIAGADLVPCIGPITFPTSARSDWDGTFGLGLPFSRSLQTPSILGLAEGFVPELHPIADGVSPIEVELARGWSVDVLVLDGAGRPLEGAEVTWRSRAHQPLRTRVWLAEHPARTDAAGQGTVRGILPGLLELSAAAPGHAPASARLQPGDRHERVELRLTRGAPFGGLVVDAAGAGVPDAAVELDDGADGERTRHARTDAQGAFEFASVPPGPYHLTAATPGSTPASRTVQVGADTAPVTIVLGAGGSIVGDVLTDRPAPYRVALVDFEGVALHERQFDAPRFQIDDVPPGDYLLRVTAAGASPQDVGPFTVTSGSTTEVPAIVPQLGSGLTGRVVAAGSGAPLAADATLFRYADGPSGTREFAARMQADVDGQVHFSALRVGRYQLLVRPVLGASTTVDEIELDGRSAVDLGPVSCSADANLELSVTDEEGEPLAGVALTVSDGHTCFVHRTGPDGRLRAERLRPGSCVASMLHLGVPVSVRGTTEAGRTTRLTLSLADCGLSRWSGRLVSGEGTPVAGAAVRALATDLAWSSSTTTSAADGSFELRGALSGSALLEVHGVRDGSQPIQLEVVFPAPGEGPAVLALPTASIEGQFDDRRAQLRLQRSAWDRSRGSLLEARGSDFLRAEGAAGAPFELAHLSPGRYTVTWLDREGRELDRQSVELGAGEALQL